MEKLILFSENSLLKNSVSSVKKYRHFCFSNGTNAVNICRFFQQRSDIKVTALFCITAWQCDRENKTIRIPVELLIRKLFKHPKNFYAAPQISPHLIVLAASCG